MRINCRLRNGACSADGEPHAADGEQLRVAVAGEGREDRTGDGPGTEGVDEQPAMATVKVTSAPTALLMDGLSFSAERRPSAAQTRQRRRSLPWTPGCGPGG